MFFVGSKGAFRAHQEHVLLEIRAYQKHVLLELRAQQIAHFEPKVLILAIVIKITKFKVLPMYTIFYYDSEEKYFMSLYLRCSRL